MARPAGAFTPQPTHASPRLTLRLRLPWGSLSFPGGTRPQALSVGADLAARALVVSSLLVSLPDSGEERGQCALRLPNKWLINDIDDLGVHQDLSSLAHVTRCVKDSQSP